LLTKAYPRLKIAEGSVNPDGKPSTPALAEAWRVADLYLSGSGSGFPASQHAAAFQKATGKPVGVFGVSTDPVSGVGPGLEPEGGTLKELRARALRLPATHLSAALRDIIDRAAFFFCRDTISLEYLKAQRVKTPILEFGPDAQLAMTLRDDARGLAYLKQHGLEARKFVCVVPRLRYTPYYRVRNTPRVPADDVKDAVNQRTMEKDHSKVRDMISAYVRSTGNKVLACAEMTYEVELAKEALVDPLPAEIRQNVVWRDTYWLPDEAASVYSQAQAVVSLECHSPLIALHNGTPALYVRQPTDTCKGQMYHDFGASDWILEVDETRGEDLWRKLERIHRDPAGAKARVNAILANVSRRQERMAHVVRAACGRSA
jgi:polysaccharide pyruvyl transferase WcaK-like protein